MRINEKMIWKSWENPVDSYCLFIYVTATAAYLLPRNTVTSDTEKYLTLAGGYVIVLALWLVLRKKEKLQEQRRREATNNNLNK